jgi:transcription elongation factor GreB
MSKAFTKEQDDDLDDEIEADASIPPGTKNYITPRGYARLQAELKDLFNVQRPETVKIVSWAAALGDRSENADYLYGKKRLREIDKRIRFLTKRLGYAEVIDPVQQPQEKIYFGATVVVNNMAGEEHTYSIVGVDEIDLTHGQVSWMSPLAKSLLGKQEGEHVIVHTPAGEQALEIVEIRYEALA